MPEKTIKDLEAEIAALKKERQRDKFAQFRRKPAVPPANVTLPPRPVLNLANMPDQMADPAAFNAELAKRTDAHYDALDAWKAKVAEAKAAATPRPDATRSWDTLWNRFAAAHPELKDQRKRIEFVAMGLMEKLQSEGVDGEQYAFEAPEDFFDDLKAGYDKEWPTAGKQPAPKRSPFVDGPEADGGMYDPFSRGDGVKQPTAEPDEDAAAEGGSVIKTLRELQMKDNYL